MVSIIIPVYNKAQHLNKCLESIVVQTYSNIEILLIDDGSTDGSGLICDQWSKRDQRITVIHQQNAGVSAARNVGINMVKGKYITFVDADDSLHVTAIATMVKEIQKDNSDIWISGLDLVLWDICNHQLDKYLLRKRKVAVWGNLYKTNIAKSVRFLEDLTNNEDFVYLFLISLKTKRISGSTTIVYIYNLSVDNSLSKIISVQKLNSSLQALEIVERNLPANLQKEYKIYKLYIYEYILTNLNGILPEERKMLIVDIHHIIGYIRQVYPQWVKKEKKKCIADRIKLLGFFLCPNFTIYAISILKEIKNGNQRQKGLE